MIYPRSWDDVHVMMEKLFVRMERQKENGSLSYWKDFAWSEIAGKTFFTFLLWRSGEEKVVLLQHNNLKEICFET